MPENVLKAMVDSIAESDNIIGGQLITRLRDAYEFGRNDGSVAAASATTLTSPVDVFEAGHVGQGIDVLAPAVGSVTGNEGSYIVATYVDTKNVTLQSVDTSSPGFIDQDPVRWRFTTLKVETTLDFPDKDPLLQVYLGKEASPIPYAELDNTPGAQEMRGIGGQTTSVFGIVDSSLPTTLANKSSIFTSAHVGSTAWILPEATANGDEGPQLITAVAADGKSCTVSPGGLATDQEEVHFVIKDYTDAGYPALDHRVKTEVYDGSQSYSALDQLRRSFLVGYADGEDLDRVGRNLFVTRLVWQTDEEFRVLLQVLPYSPKTTVYGLELVLEAIYPGAWEVYEDVVNFPNQVFILLDIMDGTSDDSDGKAFLSETGEALTSTSTTSVTVTDTPITVAGVVIDPLDEELDMSALPSAATPAWTYSNQGDTEGNVFTISSSWLTHTQNSGNANGGAYYIDTVLLDDLVGSVAEISGWWKVTSYTSAGGHPWHIGIFDDAVDREYFLFWNNAQCFIGQSDETQRTTPVTPTSDLDDGKAHHFRLRRTSRASSGGIVKHVVQAWVDGEDLFGEVDLSGFSTTTVSRYSFGYFNNSNNQTWIAAWDTVRYYANSKRNYYNLTKVDGSFAGTNDNLVSSSNPFVAGDANKQLRVREVGSTGVSASRNIGLWEVSAYVSASTVTLDGILHEDIISVSNDGTYDLVTADDPIFIPEDVGKTLTISGSSLGNNGDVTVDYFVTPWIVRVTLASGNFVDELTLSAKFKPDTFTADALVTWELIEAGSEASKVLTLREALPATTTDVLVHYTTVLSAQILLNEFVSNTGVAPTLYYPFYLFDVDSGTRSLMDAITAAGVIPAYEREF